MKKIKIITVFFILLMVMLFSYGCTNQIFIRDFKSSGNIFPMYGKNIEKNFYIPVNIGDSLKLKWESGINGSFYGTSVTAVDKIVFVPDLSGRVYAFNLNDGHEIGNIRYKGIIVSTPIINDTRIIFPVVEKNSSNTSIYYYDISQGVETNKYTIEGVVQPDLISRNYDLFYVTEEGRVGKISYGIGKIWEYNTKSFVHSSPVLVNNSIVFGNDKGDIISVDAGSGKLNYRKTIGKGFEGGFTVSGNVVYTADQDGKIFAVDPNNGSIKWVESSGVKINTTPVLDDKSIYLNNLKGEIFKLDKQTGKMIWKISSGGLTNITPIVFNDYLVQPDLNKKLYFINKENGAIKRTFSYENRVKLTPVFYNNILFVGTDNGEIYAYEPIK